MQREVYVLLGAKVKGHDNVCKKVMSVILQQINSNIEEDMMIFGGFFWRGQGGAKVALKIIWMKAAN